MSADNSAEQDLLRLIESGLSSSADKLAALSQTKWRTQTVSVHQAPLTRFQSLLSRDDKDHYGCYFSMPGGVFLVMFPKRSGGVLADAFMPLSVNRPMPEQWERDVVAEISNIIVHAVANTLADACHETFSLSAPETVVGRKEELIGSSPQKFKPSGENYAIMAYVQISSTSLSSDCTVALLLNSILRDRLTKALNQ